MRGVPVYSAIGGFLRDFDAAGWASKGVGSVRAFRCHPEGTPTNGDGELVVDGCAGAGSVGVAVARSARLVVHGHGVEALGSLYPNPL